MCQFVRLLYQPVGPVTYEAIFLLGRIKKVRNPGRAGYAINRPGGSFHRCRVGAEILGAVLDAQSKPVGLRSCRQRNCGSRGAGVDDRGQTVCRGNRDCCRARHRSGGKCYTRSCADCVATKGMGASIIRKGAGAGRTADETCSDRVGRAGLPKGYLVRCGRSHRYDGTGALTYQNTMGGEGRSARATAGHDGSAKDRIGCAALPDKRNARRASGRCDDRARPFTKQDAMRGQCRRTGTAASDHCRTKNGISRSAIGHKTNAGRSRCDEGYGLGAFTKHDGVCRQRSKPGATTGHNRSTINWIGADSLRDEWDTGCSIRCDHRDCGSAGTDKNVMRREGGLTRPAVRNYERWGSGVCTLSWIVDSGYNIDGGGNTTY